MPIGEWNRAVEFDRAIENVVALRKRGRRRVRRAAGANAIVRPAPGRDGRRDSDVAKRLAGCGLVSTMKPMAPQRQPQAPSRGFRVGADARVLLVDGGRRCARPAPGSEERLSPKGFRTR
jgi:hypothetical protein